VEQHGTRAGFCDRMRVTCQRNRFPIQTLPSPALNRSGVVGNWSRHAGGVEDGVGDCRAQGNDGRLAATGRRRLAIIHQDDLILRQPREARQGTSLHAGIGCLLRASP